MNKALWCPKETSHCQLLKDLFGFDCKSFELLLPAALRPVINVEFAIRSLLQLMPGDQTLQLVIAGGVIDKDYAEFIRNMLSYTFFSHGSEKFHMCVWEPI